MRAVCGTRLFLIRCPRGAGRRCIERAAAAAVAKTGELHTRRLASVERRSERMQLGKASSVCSCAVAAGHPLACARRATAVSGQRPSLPPRRQDGLHLAWADSERRADGLLAAGYCAGRSDGRTSLLQTGRS